MPDVQIGTETFEVCDEVQEMLDDQQASIERLVKQNEKQEESLRQASANASIASARIKELERQVKLKEAGNTNLKSENEAQTRTIKRMQGEIAGLRDEKENLNQKNGKSYQRRLKLAAENTELKKAIISASEDLTTMGDEYRALRVESARRGRLIERHERRMKRLHSRILRQRQTMSDLAKTASLYKTHIADSAVMELTNKIKGGSLLGQLFG